MSKTTQKVFNHRVTEITEVPQYPISALVPFFSLFDFIQIHDVIPVFGHGQKVQPGDLLATAAASIG